MDSGHLPELEKSQAPKIAREYYNLGEDAKFRDMVLAIRADESIHREFNHYFSELKPEDEVEELDISVIGQETKNITNEADDEEALTGKV